MKTQNAYTSKIATIVYKNYTENVDMNNELFKQSELDALIKSDKDIVRVDYYIEGVLVGNKLYSERQAISQIIKINKTICNVLDSYERDGGSDWRGIIVRNEARDRKMEDLYNKERKYKAFVTEEGFENSQVGLDACCTFEEWKQ